MSTSGVNDGRRRVQGLLPPSVKAGLESLSRLCVDVEYELEALDLAVGRARVECERARLDEAALTYRPRSAVTWDLQSRLYGYYNEVRCMYFDRNAIYALAAGRVLRMLLDDQLPAEHDLVVITRLAKERNLLDDGPALAVLLPELRTGDTQVDDVLLPAHRAVTRALGAAHGEDLLWSQAHLTLAELVDDPADVDPPAAPGEPGINAALRAYAQTCHGVAIGLGHEGPAPIPPTAVPAHHDGPWPR